MINKVFLMGFVIAVCFTECQAQRILIAMDTLTLEVGYGWDITINGKKNGLWKYYYNNDTSKVKFSVFFKEDTLNGEFVAFWENGKTKACLNFNNGVKEGKALYYEKDGWLKYKVNYENDLLDGVVEEYYKSGRRRKKLNFKEGRMDGVCLAFNDDRINSVSAEGEFRDGIRHGRYISYTGKKNKIIEYFENGFPIRNRQIFVDDQIVSEDVLDRSKYVFVKTITYKEGKPNSEYEIEKNSVISEYFIYGNYLFLPPNFNGTVN